MSIKAQTPREPTLPSRAPTTLPQATAEDRHARPHPRLEEEETTARPLFTHSDMCRINLFNFFGKVVFKSSRSQNT